MKIEFNGNSYSIGSSIGLLACTGCVLLNNKNKCLECPTNSEGVCILPFDKIYTGVNFFQVFKL